MWSGVIAYSIWRGSTLGMCAKPRGQETVAVSENGVTDGVSK